MTPHSRQFLCHAQRLVLYLQTLTILEARSVPKMSVEFIAVVPSVVRDSRRGGRAGIARHIELVLLHTLTSLFTRGAHVSLSYGIH
jgi:hypothetical protein